MAKRYEVVRGYEVLAVGTTKEICEKLGIKKETLEFYRSPAYIKRRKNLDDCIMCFKIEDDENDYKVN